MATKMRLQRFGKKGQPFYHIVITDGRAPRDGRFIEKLGTYNPLVRPADIQLDFDRALYWVQKGAVPSPTVKALLKYTGVSIMHHLKKGVLKNALTEEQANAKFEQWKSAKDAKISSAKNDYRNAEKQELKKRLDAEIKVNEAKAELLAKKRQAEAKAASAANEVAETEAVVEAETDVVVENVETTETQETAPTSEETNTDSQE